MHRGGILPGKVSLFIDLEVAPLTYHHRRFDYLSWSKAEEVANDSCKKLLVNPNTQTYTYEIIS